MYAETQIYVEVNGQLHAKAALLLGKHFLITPEQDRSLAQGTVWRFGKEDKAKECGAVGN
jgi:hypothetical protein